jgi:hypothetical protein
MKFNNIIINGEKVSKEIPEAYHLLSWRKFISVAYCDKYPVNERQSRIISALTDIPFEDILSAKIKNFDVFLSCISFLQYEMTLIIPTTIQKYPVPTNIEDEAAARYGDIQEIINRFGENKLKNVELYPEIVSRYICPSPYDWKIADKIALELQEAPCSEVMAIGNFTLTRLAASKNGILKTFPREATRLSKWKQVILIWLKSLDSSIRFALWKRSLPSSARKYLNGH